MWCLSMTADTFGCRDDTFNSCLQAEHGVDKVKEGVSEVIESAKNAVSQKGNEAKSAVEKVKVRGDLPVVLSKLLSCAGACCCCPHLVY
jgi:hypothetical protein